MNYEHVCAKLIWYIMLFSCSGGILYLLYRIDEDLVTCSYKKIILLWTFFCFGVCVVFCVKLDQVTLPESVAYLCLAVYLVVCSVMDCLLQMVCDFLQYIGAVGGIILIAYSLPQKEFGVSLIIFAILQWQLFMKMYGAADAMAFLICALYLAANNRGIQDYLVHMFVAFLLLGIVQITKKNVSSKGDLKCPVALLPYITASFLLII